MKTITILVMSILMSVQFAQADLLVPGKKSIDYCLKIDNVKEFPQYVFLLYPVKPNSTGYEIIEQGGCVDFYKLNSPNIYLVTEDEMRGLKLGDNEEKERIFFTKVARNLSHGLEISRIGFLERNDSRQGITEVFHIISKGETLFLKRTKYIDSYDDGMIKERRP